MSTEGESMRDEKQQRKAKRMQAMTRALLGLRGHRQKHAHRETFVETSKGPIRVLEYGFETDQAAPLFVDMHGGGFVLLSAD